MNDGSGSGGIESNMALSKQENWGISSFRRQINFFNGTYKLKKTAIDINTINHFTYTKDISEGDELIYIIISSRLDFQTYLYD